MSTGSQDSRELLATVDARTLETIRWGPLRQLFPKFVEEIELGRYLKRLLASGQYSVVRLAPRRPGLKAPTRNTYSTSAHIRRERLL